MAAGPVAALALSHLASGMIQGIGASSAAKKQIDHDKWKWIQELGYRQGRDEVEDARFKQGMAVNEARERKQEAGRALSFLSSLGQMKNQMTAPNQMDFLKTLIGG